MTNIIFTAHISVIMEQLAPRLSLAAKILAALTLVASTINLKINIFDKPGLSVEEFIGIGIAIVFAILAIITSKQRIVPEFSSNPSLEQQISALEITPTKSSNIFTEQKTSNTQTQQLIESIVGKEINIDTNQIDNAIDKLSSGEIGLKSQMMVEQAPAPHRYATDILSSNEKKSNSNTSEKTTYDVPLPNFNAIEELPELPDISSIIAPLPVNGQNYSTPVLPKIKTSPVDESLEKSVELPDLTDLDSLLNENIEARFDTPDLPNLNDIL